MPQRNIFGWGRSKASGPTSRQVYESHMREVERQDATRRRAEEAAYREYKRKEAKLERKRQKIHRDRERREFMAQRGVDRREAARLQREASDQRRRDREAMEKRHGYRNPIQLLFPTRAAALKYAREHGAKRFSIRKVTGA